MAPRCKRETVTFVRPFWLKSIGRTLPAGGYEVVTDEDLVEGVSFPVYRRVSTMILVPAQSAGMSAMESMNIDPLELQAALDRDAATLQPPTDDGVNLVPEPKPMGGRL